MSLKSGYFSELFPKTFSYLKKYITAKYPKFKGELPDVRVLILETGIIGIMGELFRGIKHGGYNEFRNVLKIYIDVCLQSKAALEKVRENPDLAARFIDTNNNTRSILIHEYQHFLQIKFARFLFTRKIDLPSKLKQRPVKEKILGRIRHELKISPIYGYVLGGFKGAVVGYLIKKLFDKSMDIFMPKTFHMIKPENFYAFNTKEIESQIAEMVFHLVLGHSPNESIIGSKFNITQEKLEQNINVLKEGIKEQERLFSISDKYSRKKIIRRIKIMKRLLLEYEKLLKFTPEIIEEAERIASKIREDIK